jgi:ferredoxin
MGYQRQMANDRYQTKAKTMQIIQIDIKDWERGLENARKSFRVTGPVKHKEYNDFKALDDGQLPDLNFQNTCLSPKSIIYPQSEVMFEYSLDEKDPDHDVMKEIRKDYPPQAVIGIRPCDAKSFLLVKRNFDTPEYKDPYWIRAYESTTFVGLACDAPCSTCFCTSAGCGPFHEEGLDLLLVDSGDSYIVKIITSKGASFAEEAGWPVQADGADALAEKVENMKTAAEGRITAFVQTDKLGDQITTELFDAPFWEDVAFACINCGTCTYSCPTCWCFDIQEEVRGKKGVRMRNWDSCMYPLFTLHGSGHNPRNISMQRVRQRFMHKLKYYVDKFENGIQCVGCGRCVRLCPVNIDIRSICNLMNSYDPAACACPA